VSVFENVAKAVNGVVNVAVVDISEEENSDIKEAFKITGSPTVLYFSDNKRYPLNIRDYDIEIVDHKILEFINDRILFMVTDRNGDIDDNGYDGKVENYSYKNSIDSWNV
jgi:hypothetical protein